MPKPMKAISPDPRICKLSDIERHSRILCLGNDNLKRTTSTLMIKKCKGVASKTSNNSKYAGRGGTHKTVVVTVRLDITYYIICEC